MPKNVQEAERAIMALLLSDPEYTEEILGACRPEMFADPDCRQILLTAQELNKREQPVDLVTVHANSEREFSPRLVEISNAYFVPANLCRYIEEVKEAWEFRTLGAGLQAALEKARAHDESCYGDIDRLRETVTPTDTGLRRAGDICPETLKELSNLGEGPQALSTGFPALDERIGGLAPGRLLVIGGRPGMGKSALALDIALEAAKREAVVLYITLEMTHMELAKRALYYLSGIGEDTVKEQGEKAMEKLRRAGERLCACRLIIRDRGDCSLAGVESASRTVKAAEGRLDLVVIDYVGLMRTERTRTSTRQQEIAEISRGLKRLAVRMPTCVLLLSQLNREADTRIGQIPRLSGLRECGDLEQDADVVLFPVREMVAAPGACASNARLYVAKNRSGSPAAIDMDWSGPTYTFREHRAARYRY